ncbi:hypothetical protein BGW38_006168 [Lunasporangiospora selenospora]|uniref:RNI-like protein n=1 Tax=Lunasporangiospora selenospora TaxID=979761 RepID=A0A9P6FZW9_9FUNG|nr:hypothetical protein BGW38_006168 [Lunasporangiospora selenospora]
MANPQQRTIDEYQRLDHLGYQEQVLVSHDEDDMPCVFLNDINRTFPNTSVISSYGVRVPFMTNHLGEPKLPLRIPYYKSRVLEVLVDHSSLGWSRRMTATEVEAAAAEAVAMITRVNTVHTDPLDLDAEETVDHSAGAHSNDLQENLVDLVLPHRSSPVSRNDEADNHPVREEGNEEEEEEEEEEILTRRIRRPARPPMDLNSTYTIQTATLSSGITTTSTVPSSTSVSPPQPSSTRVRTVQSLERISPGLLTPVAEEDSGPIGAPLRQSPSPQPLDESALISTAVSIAPLQPRRRLMNQSSHRIPFSEEPEILHGALPPPSYSAVDTHSIISEQSLYSISTNTSTLITSSTYAPSLTSSITPSEEPADRSPVLDHVGRIKHWSTAILSQKYPAEACPHPPLFILLPENPLQWISDNILHNKMRLYFLCDCCEHDASSDNQAMSGRRAIKRNVHIDESRGFEIRLDQYPDQLLLIRLGRHILDLLQMLQHGVSLQDISVASAHDRPLPPQKSASTSTERITPAMDRHLQYKQKQNLERSIAFLEVLLGVENAFSADETAAEPGIRLNMNDFRLLDQIVRRTPYTQSVDSDHGGQDQSTTLNDIHRSGSGLYKIHGWDGAVRWSCRKYYNIKHRSMDMTLVNSLESLRGNFNHHLRAIAIIGNSERHLMSEIMALSRIQSLFRIDLSLDWSIPASTLASMAEHIQRYIPHASTISIKLGNNTEPMEWRNQGQTSSWDTQPPIMGLLSLFRSTSLKHLLLEGDIDLASVPNIDAMGFSSLEALSVMKNNHRGLGFNSSRIGYGDRSESVPIPLPPPQRTTYTEERYIPWLASFLPSFPCLKELVLGFTDVVPGHIRILQTCIAGLSCLSHLELFKLQRNLSATDNNNNKKINRKLELSANIKSSRLTRLYLSECRTSGVDGKARLLQSLEELLTDEGATIEDLEVRFIGFNDRHAHALELGTRPTEDGQPSCRLRRLVIHGKGLQIEGARAMREVLGRATPLNGPDSPRESTYPELEPCSLNGMMDQPTLVHLELCSMDSLQDMDWSRLLMKLNLTRLVVLNLQGVSLGENALATLIRNATSADPSMSFSRPLALQTLRLSCVSLSREGTELLHRFLPRLTHLSTLSIHGFRNMTAPGWIGLLSQISLQWIEMIDIVSSGFDNSCAKYLGERIQAREQVQEAIEASEESHYGDLSTYGVTSATAMGSTLTLGSISSFSSSPPPTPTSENGSIRTVSRRDSLTGRFFSLGSNGAASTSSISGAGSNGQRSKSKEFTRKDLQLPASPTSPTSPSPARKTPSHKYLEIDLRYTDVSTKDLDALKTNMAGLAKKVIVRLRDGEDDPDVAALTESWGIGTEAKVGQSHQNGSANGGHGPTNGMIRKSDLKKSESSQGLGLGLSLGKKQSSAVQSSSISNGKNSNGNGGSSNASAPSGRSTTLTIGASMSSSMSVGAMSNVSSYSGSKPAKNNSSNGGNGGGGSGGSKFSKFVNAFNKNR